MRPSRQLGERFGGFRNWPRADREAWPRYWGGGGGAGLYKRILPRVIRDPSEPNDIHAEWLTMADSFGDGVAQFDVSSLWMKPTFVRFFLTDESVACVGRGRHTCVNRLIRPLSPIYRLDPNEQSALYYQTADEDRGFFHPGIRIRIFWDDDPMMLQTSGTPLFSTKTFRLRGGKTYVWRRIERDNERIDNRNPRQPVEVGGRNLIAM